MPFFWTSWFRAQENLDKATFVFPTFDLGFNRQNVGVICEVQEAAPFESAPTGNQHYEFELAVDLPIFMKGIRAEENQCDGYEKITIIKSNLIFPLKTKQHALIYEDFKWDFFSLLPSMSGCHSAVHIKCTKNKKGKECRLFLLERLPIKFFKPLTWNTKYMFKNLYWYLCISICPTPIPLFPPETEPWNCTKESATKNVDQILLQFKCDVGRDKTKLI